MGADQREPWRTLLTATVSYVNRASVADVHAFFIMAAAGRAARPRLWQ